MDDTRDIAIKAKASSESAHLRLNTINGQIGRLGESHERMRGDFDRAINDPTTGLRAELASVTAEMNEKLDDALNNPEHGLRREISDIKTDVKVHVARLTVIVTVVSIVGGAGASALASHYLNSHQQHPAQATTQAVIPRR